MLNTNGIYDKFISHTLELPNNENNPPKARLWDILYCTNMFRIF